MSGDPQVDTAYIKFVMWKYFKTPPSQLTKEKRAEILTAWRAHNLEVLHGKRQEETEIQKIMAAVQR